MIKSFTISWLAERCQVETELYKRTGQSNQEYCLELFRRALTEANTVAWQAIYTQYEPLVTSWVYSYSRFLQTGEEADFFVNGAFARMWQSGSKPKTAGELSDSLGKCLRYLKLCVASAIEDHLRTVEKDALKRQVPLKDYDQVMPGGENQKDSYSLLIELRQELWKTVQNEVERLVAEESWVYGFAPRQVQARNPDIFVSVQEVSQIKRNILKRLRRKLIKQADIES